MFFIIVGMVSMHIGQVYLFPIDLQHVPVIKG